MSLDFGRKSRQLYTIFKSLARPSFADRFKKKDNEPKVAKEKAPKVEKVKKEKKK